MPRYRLPVRKFVEDARAARVRPPEDILLCHEAHFEVELIEFAGERSRARPRPGSRRDLKIAVEARDHEHLLEQLGRLRQRVELAGCVRSGRRKSRAPLRRDAVRIGVSN